MFMGLFGQKNNYLIIVYQVLLPEMHNIVHAALLRLARLVFNLNYTQLAHIDRKYRWYSAQTTRHWHCVGPTLSLQRY